jgi:hypothetical protein
MGKDKISPLMTMIAVIGKLKTSHGRSIQRSAVRIQPEGHIGRVGRPVLKENYSSRFPSFASDRICHSALPQSRISLRPHLGH